MSYLTRSPWGSSPFPRPGDDLDEPEADEPQRSVVDDLLRGADPAVSPLPGFYQANPPREREHITQKPVEVMRKLVRIAPKGGTVLDLFMGSGTTGVAAVLEGRDFVGVEMIRSHFETAERRITTSAQGYKDDGAQLALA